MNKDEKISVKDLRARFEPGKISSTNTTSVKTKASIPSSDDNIGNRSKVASEEINKRKSRYDMDLISSKSTPTTKNAPKEEIQPTLKIKEKDRTGSFGDIRKALTSAKETLVDKIVSKKEKVSLTVPSEIVMEQEKEKKDSFLEKMKEKVIKSENDNSAKKTSPEKKRSQTLNQIKRLAQIEKVAQTKNDVESNKSLSKSNASAKTSDPQRERAYTQPAKKQEPMAETTQYTVEPPKGEQNIGIDLDIINLLAREKEKTNTKYAELSQREEALRKKEEEIAKKFVDLQNMMSEKRVRSMQVREKESKIEQEQRKLECTQAKSLQLLVINKDVQGLTKTLSALKNANIADEAGTTVLHFAAEKDNIECMKCILTHSCKADPNLQSQNKSIPLHYAAQNNNLTAINLLLKNEDSYISNALTRDYKGKTPRDYLDKKHANYAGMEKALIDAEEFVKKRIETLKIEIEGERQKILDIEKRSLTAIKNKDPLDEMAINQLYNSLTTFHANGIKKGISNTILLVEQKETLKKLVTSLEVQLEQNRSLAIENIQRLRKNNQVVINVQLANSSNVTININNPAKNGKEEVKRTFSP